MNHLSRVIVALILLVGCGTSPQQARSDVDLVADVVKIEMPLILPALSPADRDRATRYAADVEAARQAIDASLASGGIINAQTLVGALQGLAPIVAANIPSNSPASIAIASAVALAPVILARFAPVTARMMATVDPEKDRMVLRGALVR